MADPSKKDFIRCSTSDAAATLRRLAWLCVQKSWLVWVGHFLLPGTQLANQRPYWRCSLDLSQGARHILQGID